MHGIARILCGDLDGGDLSLQDAVSIGEQVDSPAAVAAALGERSLIAMARSEWDLAEALTGQAGTVLRQAGIEESFATPLVRAMRARMALHRGDAQAARRELVSAQHPRRLLTYALPHIAVQVRIELIRAHLALADLAGARTLMREVDDLLRRGPRPGGSAWPEHRPWMPGPWRCFKPGRRWPSGHRHPAWNGASPSAGGGHDGGGDRRRTAGDRPGGRPRPGRLRGARCGDRARVRHRGRCGGTGWLPTAPRWSRQPASGARLPAWAYGPPRCG